MYTKFKKTILMFTSVSVFSAILLSIIRIVLSQKMLETGIEMYTHNSTAMTVFHIVLSLIGILLIISGFFTALKHKSNIRNSQNVSQLTVFTSMLCAFMLVAYFLLSVYDAMISDWAILGPLFGRPATASVTMASAVFTLLLLICTIPAAIYFFKVSAATAYRPSFSVFATLVGVWFMLLALHAYFNTTTAFNSPVKIFHIITLLSMMFYALQEARLSLEIANLRLYFATAYLTVFLGTVHTISDTVLYAQKRIDLQGGYLGITIEAVYVLYILSRLLSFAVSRTRPPVHDTERPQKIQ